MSNSVAEAYLLILRPSMIPVIGEAVPIPFNEQIELDEWSWKLVNDERAAIDADRAKRKAAAEAKKTGASPAAAPAGPKVSGDLTEEGYRRAIAEMQKRPGLSQEQRDKGVRDLLKRQADARKKAGAGDADSASDESEHKNKLTFTFKKNVDAATTQLLNSMKAADLMPRALVTLFHRSVNAPVTLVITFGNVRLINYSLSVDTSETMSDMKEEWTATYESVGYVYQNRPAASGPTLTKGTARVFAMIPKD
jgi:type VI protein secretion system component Hcp